LASPAIGSVSTPKILAAKSDAVSKRLLSKDPKKARAVEATKDKKRKEREVVSAASDRESGNPARKRQVTHNNNPKVKSAPVVHSSSDEMDDDSTVKVSHKRSDPPPKSATQGKLPGVTRKTAPNTTAKPIARLPPTIQANSPVASDRPASGKAGAASSQKLNGAAAASAGPNKSLTTAKKSNAVGKNTPSGLVAPAVQRAQNSPQLNGNRTHVPSPLGAAARSRGTSDGSDKLPVETQRNRAGADTPGENVIVNRHRKELQSARADAERPAGDVKALPRKPMPSVPLPPKPPQQANGTVRAIPTAQKRKPVDSPTEDVEDAAKPKQRRYALTANNNTGKRGLDSNGETVSSSDSASSIADEITFSQALDMAERFNEMYPRYSRLYDEYETRSSRGEIITKRERDSLLRLHDQLEQWKQDIVAAAERENGSMHERRTS
jgi:RNA polymerase II elongation factor ELL